MIDAQGRKKKIEIGNLIVGYIIATKPKFGPKCMSTQYFQSMAKKVAPG